MTHAVDQFHNSSPIHDFYRRQSDYSRRLRQCFVKWHCKHLTSTAVTNEIYASLADDGFWYGLDLSASPLFKRIKTALLAKYSLDSDRQYSIFSLNSSEVIDSWKLLQSQPLLLPAIYQYIANPSVVIHESYLFLRRRCTPNESVQTSGFWHRDAMGTRLKVFICLDNTAGTPGTSVVGHPYLDPLPHEWEMIRATNPSYSDNLMNQLSQRIQSFGSTTVNQEPGSVMILDTNTIHRGEYQCSPAVNPFSSSSTRALIVFSFIASDAYSLYSQLNKKPYAHDTIPVPSQLFQSMPLASPPYIPISAS
jgi:hypothetical protein